MDRNARLQRLLNPRTVAVFGGDSAATVVEQCQKIGFDGETWPVNPSRETLAGLKCFDSVRSLPGIPDASFVAAPPEPSLEIIRQLASAGAPGAVCFAAGFAEVGRHGALLQQQLREAAGDMPVIGPNCHGFLNYLDSVALWPDEHGGTNVDRGAALITQSGNIAINLTMQQRGLDLSYVISAGNNSTLGMHDYIDALLGDPRVTAIGMHIEGLNDVAAFSEAALRALSKGVPIVVFKAGRSKRGAEITMSHTGSLAGSDTLFDALFDRLGIARCDTVSQFLETLKFVSTVGVLPDATIASMSCSGGDASIVADNAERLGLRTPPLNAETSEALQALLGPNVDVANPLDYHLYIWGDVDKLTACFTEVLKNGFACSLLVLDYPGGEDNDDSNWRITEDALRRAVRTTGHRAVVVSSLVETLSRDARERLKASGITAMQGIEDCLFAIRSAARIGRAARRAQEIRPIAAPKPIGEQAEVLDEYHSKQRMAAAGLAIPRGQLCRAETAPEAAGALGFPVVVKGVSNEVLHKSDLGAVHIGVNDADAVRSSVASMGTRFDTFLVEEMVGPVVAELIVGIKRDPQFGLALVIGSGGTLVELLHDTVSLLLPVDRSEIMNAMTSLKAGTLISGYRGGPAGDLDKAVDAIAAIAGYASANAGELLELDVNPLIVTPDSAVAVDALIRNSRSIGDE